MRKKIMLVMVVVGLFSTSLAYSQDVAVKANLLYGANGSIKIGMEYGLSKKMTLDLYTSINLWKPKVSRNRRLNHILVQPELRFWLCERFNGHFFGVHAHYAYYNIGGKNVLLNSAFALSTLAKEDLKNTHRKGWLLGAGVSYGYHWILHKRWSLEATLGFGYAYMDYEAYLNPVCGAKIEDQVKHYFGPTKLGLTLIFMIK